MIEIEDGASELAKVASGDIAKLAKPLSIGQLEFVLSARYPRKDAEEWDRMGLLVGDPAARVTGVAVALDATSKAIEAAKRLGANVLLTHHPAFLDSPVAFSPSYDLAAPAGVNVYVAISEGIALMNYHTALDVSAAALRLLPRLLNLDFQRVLVPLAHDDSRGYGQLCAVRADDEPFKLAHLSARCTSVFGRAPRVWGDLSTPVKRVVIANGSAGNVVEASLRANADCLVCGELRYHASLDAAQAGLAIVELGHDVSELPLCALLAQAATDAGVAVEDVHVIDQSGNWVEPDSIRM